MNSGWFLASYILLWLFMVGSLLLWLAVLRQIGVLHNRWGPRGALMTEDGPEVGASVPRFIALSVAGSELPFPGSEFLNLSVLTNPGCATCEELAPALGALIKDPPEGVRTMVLVTDGGEQAAQELSSKHKLDPTRVASAPGASELLKVTTTPMALLMDKHGHLLNKGVVNSLEQIEVLVAQARSAESMDHEESDAEAPEIVRIRSNAMSDTRAAEGSIRR